MGQYTIGVHLEIGAPIPIAVHVVQGQDLAGNTTQGVHDECGIRGIGALLGSFRAITTATDPGRIATPVQRIGPTGLSLRHQFPVQLVAPSIRVDPHFEWALSIRTILRPGIRGHENGCTGKKDRERLGNHGGKIGHDAHRML